MTAQCLDGKKVAQKQQEKIKAQIAQRLAIGKRAPKLAVILVGHDPASHIYVQNKRKACAQVGMQSQSFNLAKDIQQDELMDLISQLNEDPQTDGILLQLPLPAHLDASAILDHILPHKDVDGFHPYNLGRLAQRRPLLRPCTPYGIMQLLNYYDLDCKGLHSVVIGTSNIVGRPMLLELLLAGSTVTNCHRFTRHLDEHVRKADLLVAAIGKRDIIKSDWLKPGCIVIDVGIHRLENGKLSGDIDFMTAKERAAWITPVPGGVGPMTISTLLENTTLAAELNLQP
ncbi:MAG: bifunctional methylenetetrahydrofolate dehydrogenase/methenyltetrahydrofolate cyclohydrolase FolD [Gammaproteobacteria bacterium]